MTRSAPLTKIVLALTVGLTLAVVDAVAFADPVNKVAPAPMDMDPVLVLPPFMVKVVAPMMVRFPAPVRTAEVEALPSVTAPPEMSMVPLPAAKLKTRVWGELMVPPEDNRVPPFKI